ncbi:hypothetical protein NDU88_010112 [Pleurodeles waltl]|uniref:Uncharacterized protein n=1 Tax=Pleurodeles waltl TaxID=8319 RepID=A0AAV7S1N1_PLEWA|nr:hypothetical protein NDU88_010112 [Pleurodeles waltl]
MRGAADGVGSAEGPGSDNSLSGAALKSRGWGAVGPRDCAALEGRSDAPWRMVGGEGGRWPLKTHRTMAWHRRISPPGSDGEPLETGGRGGDLA